MNKDHFKHQALQKVLTTKSQFEREFFLNQYRNGVTEFIQTVDEMQEKLYQKHLEKEAEIKKQAANQKRAQTRARKKAQKKIKRRSGRYSNNVRNKPKEQKHVNRVSLTK